MPEDNGRHDHAVRIGDAERDAAIEVLRTAAGEGRITVEELDDRIEVVAVARFAVDLDHVLADIVTTLPSDHLGMLVRGAPDGARSEARPGESPGNREILRPRWTGLTKDGRWSVRPYLRCEPAGVLLELNFLEVVTDLEIIDIDVSARTGTLKIIIPDSWGVDSTGLVRGPIAVIRFRANESAQEGNPTIRVHGNIGSGVFIVRGPSFRQRYRMKR
ncbi:DUF1707 domain-containing protein [Brevibacterium sp. FME37]|uniref:DUF1707 SHOCT-like domain-containing protein n=1 Tax=Brevibacterium sp. FME37 TaxID=2742607 RepID=UPI0018662109|nr:DUF1707 domain-containing protein [Brevibacterium sp. FME37]